MKTVYTPPLPLTSLRLLAKADAATPCLTATGAGTIAIKAGTYVRVGSVIVPFAAQAAAAIDAGALAAGMDYAVYVTATGVLIYSANFSAPTGYAAADVLKVGGFHYAPGANAAAQAGGSAVPAINPYSIWDLHFRPTCPDPRGMALVANGFWCDIYLTGTTPDVDGTSKHGATIADGSSLPKIPAAFGGNGSASYAAFTQYNAAELARAYGKRLLTQHDHAAAAYGITEGSSSGGDPGTTQIDAARTSKWGIIQAAGNMWVWGEELLFYPHTTALTGTPPADADLATWIDASKAGSWKAITSGRGSAYTYGANGLAAALYGGYWFDGADAGSRCSYWFVAPSGSGSNIGARCRCDHLVLT